jgi:hypothetical protein
MDSGKNIYSILESGNEEIDDLVAITIVLAAVRSLYARMSQDESVAMSQNGQVYLELIRSFGAQLRTAQDQLVWEMVNSL